MEPSFVKPPSEGKGLGKRGTRKGKNFFPVVIYVLAMAGQDAGAGWNVLAAFWTTGARMLNTSECERERDAWSRHFADTARRHKRSRASVSSAPVADQDADAFVLWHFAEKFSFEPVVHLPKASFKGEQLQNLQKLPQDLCGTLFGKTGVSEVPGNAPMEKTLPRQWSHAPAAYCFKVPEEMARVKHFVTPATFCGTLRITPEEAPPLPLDVSKNKQQFASKQIGGTLGKRELLCKRFCLGSLPLFCQMVSMPMKSLHCASVSRRGLTVPWWIVRPFQAKAP